MGGAMNPIIIIGSGLAGYTVAREFRKLDSDTPLTIVTANEGCFYSKPMLSNAFTSGKTPETLASFTAEQMAEQLDATILSHARVTAIDTAQQYVIVNGEELAYTRLVLALGADPAKSDLLGNATEHVLSVNDLDDYTRFRQAIENAERIVILGAGLIGCEFANDLSSAGYTVDVVHPGQVPMNQLLPREASISLQQALASLGVHWHLGKKAVSVDYSTTGYRVDLSDGSSLKADVVLSAIGLRPRTGLAETSGLMVKRGIIVNKLLATSAPHVYALGDCAEVEGMVLPFVLPIMQAARALAKTLDGTATPLSYPAMPVVIKTPACPIVVSTHPGRGATEWRTEVSEDGVRSLCYDASDSLQGFALTGKATGEKGALIQQLPHWL
jgi:rubredoxin-NAD+ reductase